MTTSSDWARLRDALGDLLELEPERRPEALARIAAEDAEFAAELARLHDAAGDEGGFLVDSAVERVAAARRRPAAPERVGPWLLESEIGSGGMGTVWRARRDDGAFEQVVAVKRVRADLARGLGDERLAAERRILATLEHAGIARLLDGGTTPDGAAYLVLEHVDGEPIDAWCDRRRLPLEARLALFVEVCAAVEYAHRKLVLHRDIKTSNVLVDAAGRPKLLDFGIAKLLDPLAGDREQTVAGGPRPMTPAWASPEQLRGEPLTLAADVWALGLLLCELTAGARPPLPEAESNERLARELETRGTPRLDELARDGAAPGVDARRLGGDLARVVARALDADPALRYPTAAGLAADVEAFLVGRPVAAHPPSTLYRTRKFVRRHAAAVALTAAAAAALVGATAVSLDQARRARLEEARAERRLTDLRELSGQFLFDFEQRLRELAGATSLRRDVTATSLRYLELMANEAGDDPALLAHLAGGFARLGRIQGSPYEPSLGDSAAAAASAERAVALAGRLAGLSPGVEADVALAEAHQLRSDLGFAAGNYAQAEADVLAAIRAARTAYAAEPRRDDLRRLLIANLARRGTLAATAGRLDDAVAAQRETLAAALEMARDDPQRLARRVLVTRMLLGQALAASGRPAEALVELEPALAGLDALRAAEPDNAALEREFSAAVDRTVVAMLAAGRAEEALPIAERGLASMEKLSALDPENDLGRFDVVASLTQVASSAIANRRYERAADAYRRALVMTREVLARDPGNVIYRLGVIDCVTGLAEIAAAEGRSSEAASGYRAARADLRAVIADAPDNAEARSDLAEVERRLAALH